MKRTGLAIISICFYPQVWIHRRCMPKKNPFSLESWTYVDYEFEELQKTFLKNRKIQLATLKKLPLNQYPEEFLIELTNQVKREVKKEMQKELLDYLKRSIDKNRQALLAMPEKQESASRQTKGSPQFINPERKYTFLDKTPMQEINPGEKKGAVWKKVWPCLKKLKLRLRMRKAGKSLGRAKKLQSL